MELIYILLEIQRHITKQITLLVYRLLSGNSKSFSRYSEKNSFSGNRIDWTAAGLNIGGNALLHQIEYQEFILLTHPGTSKLKAVGQVNPTTGLFVATDNSNSIITINRHPESAK
jgi:hypothetical protein